MKLPYRGSGKVYYNNKSYQCDLYYNEDLGGILLKINVPHKKALSSFLEVPLELTHLYGQLDSGFRFTLLRLTRTGMEDLLSYGKTVYTFVAKYILCGIGKKEQSEQTFYKAKYVLSNIIEWGKESVFRIGEHFELISKNEDIRRILYKDRGISIAYTVDGSSFPIVDDHLLQERIELLQFGSIELEFEEEAVLECFNDVFDKVRGLIEIATLRKINVERVHLYSHDICQKIGRSKYDRPIEVYGANIQKIDVEEPSKNRWWRCISLSELIDLSSFSHYFNKHEKLAPIIELYLELFSPNNKIRAFLNIVQALETYHSRFVTNDIKEFKENIEKLVANLPDSRAEEVRGFMIANSQKFITLESRIADLILAKWKIHFDTGEIQYYDFPEIIAATRNYYIHYDEGIKKRHRVLTEKELQIYNRVLIQILEYYILIEIGFSNESCELRKRITDRWGKVSQDIELLRISREQHRSI